MRGCLRLAALWLACGLGLLAQDVAPVRHEPNGLNSAKAQRAHYVVLVSLDGFRWDYAAKYGATRLQQMARRGASAPDGMIPSYPTLTFPNHYTIVTGLYPEHHGIVGNKFLAPDRNYGQYSYNSEVNTEGAWYSGVPLWSLAEQQGMRSATMYWVGSQAEIAGKRPSYWVPFDDHLSEEKRVDQVLAWLKLPPAERPHFITLYYANIDHAGHDFGPDSQQTRDAVARLDAMLGRLQDGLKATHLPVDLVVVSDHGVILFKEHRWIDIQKLADLSSVKAAPETHLYGETEADKESAYQSLVALHDDRFSVYRLKDVPARLHYNSNPRIGDPVIVWTQPYALRTMVDPKRTDPVTPKAVGEHGFDVATVPQMKAIFYASGPDIRSGVKLPSFENVNVYAFICNLLGLEPAQNDGDARVLAPALKSRRRP